MKIASIVLCLLLSLGLSTAQAQVCMESPGPLGIATAPDSVAEVKMGGRDLYRAPHSTDGTGIYNKVGPGTPDGNAAGLWVWPSLYTFDGGDPTAVHNWLWGTGFESPLIYGARSINNAATVWIRGAPIGSNVVNPYALMVMSGFSHFGGPARISGPLQFDGRDVYGEVFSFRSNTPPYQELMRLDATGLYLSVPLRQ